MAHPTPLPPSTANWHWKNKNVTPWAKTWFERELTTIIIEGTGSEKVSISRVVDVDGDVELGQRKSKYVSALDLEARSDLSGISRIARA